ncbi:Uncharacterised protein [Salmonella enterica subsp. enterica]|uniref:Uncharacterized protein n=1 Tax=Salmonella enterica I TaxID=59201 RepID=A0A447U6A2_SALET|nr:Uncharacterised protein [Salmonella enterica subsp. enterica]
MVEATEVSKSTGAWSAVFLFNAFHYAVPQLGGRVSSASQEGLVTLIRSVVFLNEVTDVLLHSASHLW